jgi:dihydropteroate synthase
MWNTNRRSLTFSRPLIMGIVNVTPDSFSDGGRWFDEAIAVQHALRLIDEGADIIDIGGESTRPGSIPVPESDELARVVPTVARLAKQIDVPISIDTMKPEVARRCVDAGAEIVNDVSGLRDGNMIAVVRDTRAAVVVMHMQGTPQTMQANPTYSDVVAEVGAFFAERLSRLAQAGIAAEQICFDPGFGFGKTTEHNWQLAARLDKYKSIGRPICLGVSRKGFLGKDREPLERVIAGLTIACRSIVAGAAQIIRTHDVAATKDMIDTLQRIAEHDRQ